MLERGDPLALGPQFRLDSPEHPKDLIHLAAEIFVLEPSDVDVLTRQRAALACASIDCHTRNVDSKKHARPSVDTLSFG